MLTTRAFGLDGRQAAHRVAGVSLIEVLVTLVILTIGLLGLVGMMAKTQTVEVEALQRGQAVILVQDIAERISNNRTNAASYNQMRVSSASVQIGGGAIDCNAPSGTAQTDACEWATALRGNFEQKTVSGAVKGVGGLMAPRACVDVTTAGGVSTAVIEITWQGMSSTFANATTCNSTADAARRSLSTVVRIANLSGV